jgi:hypothetical protein
MLLYRRVEGRCKLFLVPSGAISWTTVSAFTLDQQSGGSGHTQREPETLLRVAEPLDFELGKILTEQAKMLAS